MEVANSPAGDLNIHHIHESGKIRNEKQEESCAYVPTLTQMTVFSWTNC